MKKAVFLLPIVALLFASFLNPAPARAALSFEDPQLCVNGNLLMVEPTTAPIEVWVKAGSALTLDFDVAHCGGDPTLPVIDQDHVKRGGPKHELSGKIKTKKYTNVLIHWQGATYTKNSGPDGLIFVSTFVD